MKFDQNTSTIDLLAAAQMERYQDMLREAEIVRQLKNTAQDQSATTASLLQRLRQWIDTPAADQPLPTTRLKGV